MEIGLLFMSLLLNIILIAKLHLLHKSAEEIRLGFAQKLLDDTNTLIDISSHDHCMRRLAADINQQLMLLRRQELSYRQGNLEITDAITNLSHDLRTPLTSICGYLDLTERTQDPDDIRRYLSIIKERTEALKQMTEELFAYSAAVSSISETSYQELSLNSFLEETLSSCYASLTESGILPRIYIPDEDVIRYLNKNALSRILGNIISNAVKYSDGDLCITLSQAGEIRFSNHADNLDEFQVMRLFDRFYTVETAAKSTGLGLSIAKNLTEQMGGTISAEYQNRLLSISVCFP